MTFPTQESSAALGQPVECLQITYGDQVWYWTSADTDITIPGVGRFLRASLTLGDVEFSEEDGAGGLEIEVPRTNPAALIFQSALPVGTVEVTVWGGHRDHLDEALVWWTGQIIRAELDGVRARLIGVSIDQALRTSAPGMIIGRQCPLVFGSPACGVIAAAYTDTVALSAVDGRTLTGAGFAARAGGWFNGGRLYAPNTPPIQILTHSGSSVTMARAVPGLAPGMVVRALAGCDRLHATCNVKFGNEVNFLGFHALPADNAFLSRVF